MEGKGAVSAQRQSRQQRHKQFCVNAVRVKIGIEDRNRHTDTISASDQHRKNPFEFRKIDTGRAWRIDGGHHRLIHHIDVEMKPESGRWCSVDNLIRASNNRIRANLAGLENVDASNLRIVDIGPCKIRIPTFPLADLNNVLIRYQWPSYTGPLSGERFTASSDQGKVHPGCRP